MGFKITVGILGHLKRCGDNDQFIYFSEIFQRLNQALQAEGHPTYKEPSHANGDSWTVRMEYIGLYYLKRLAAHIALYEELPKPVYGEPFEEDNSFHTYIDTLGLSAETHHFDHLLFHSDCLGFYLPVDFETVIFPDIELEIPGDMIGSSYRLRDECRNIAKYLQLEGEFHFKPDEFLKACEHPEGGALWQQYPVESYVCIVLYQASLKSIQSGSAIVFHS
ncbi:MAG TPA: hypothetical protein PLC07_02775 [Bacillota bacterium]|nr:hypothetical protein [Bacillota bacterium]